jgi:hypothetical protein
MRNFDMQQDLTFEVGGEQFTLKTVRPEVLAAWEDSPLPDSGTASDSLKVIDERILQFIDNGDGP